MFDWIKVKLGKDLMRPRLLHVRGMKKDKVYISLNSSNIWLSAPDFFNPLSHIGVMGSCTGKNKEGILITKEDLEKEFIFLGDL